jgi:hypothetical protein
MICGTFSNKGVTVFFKLERVKRFHVLKSKKRDMHDKRKSTLKGRRTAHTKEGWGVLD